MSTTHSSRLGPGGCDGHPASNRLLTSYRNPYRVLENACLGKTRIFGLVPIIQETLVFCIEQ
jgi:hypothetical protein